MGTVLLMLPFSSAEKVITPFHEALFHSHFGGMCYRSCGKGHWKLLVPGRPDDHSCTHTNRWAWSSDCGCVCFPSFRKENIPHAKKHHAECNFSSKSRRNRQTNKVYFEGNIFDRSCRDGVAATGFYGRLWKKRESGCQFFIQSLLFVMPALIFWGQIPVCFHR